VKAVDSSDVERAVARCAAKQREIAAAYVFGSVASGRARSDSDVDVAVLLARPLSASRALSYRLKLMAEFGSALHRSDVDLVLLNDASPLLAHRVLSKGRLAFERSRSARVRFQVQTASRYADVVPMYETQIRYLKRQARSGGRRG
jgi:predicted nucleotidyltransferase